MRTLAAVTGLWLIACVGCVTSSNVSLDTTAAKIKVVRESDKPLRCKNLADVHGVGRGSTETKARENAQNDIRNAAAKYKGANYVLVDADRGGAVGTTDTREAFLNGKAMNCKEDESAGDAPAGGDSTGASAAPAETPPK